MMSKMMSKRDSELLKKATLPCTPGASDRCSFVGLNQIPTGTGHDTFITRETHLS
jgi:hypothetical protein